MSDTLISEQTYISRSDKSIINADRVKLTSGLEQTIVPTTGSYLPEVVPWMFLKVTSEIVRLLCPR